MLDSIDGDMANGIWPKAVVFLSNQLYNLNRPTTGACRIPTSGTTTLNHPNLKSYLQRASQNGVKIIIRLYPSPGNFDENYDLMIDALPLGGYCYPQSFRPAQDIIDEMIAIHNYNTSNGITEWGFEPANEPNVSGITVVHL